MPLVGCVGRRFVLTLSVCCLACASAAAQRFPARHFGPEHGLNDATVLAVLKDRAGYLWVGTQDGLFRFDGFEFIRFGVEDGLSADVAKTMLQTSDGTLWVASDRGLAYRSGDRFRTVRFGFDLRIRSRTALAADERGRLFVATDHGVAIGAPTGSGSHEFQFLPLPEPLDSMPMHSVAIEARAGQDDALWFGCGTALCSSSAGVVDTFDRSRGVPADRWRATRLGVCGRAPRTVFSAERLARSRSNPLPWRPRQVLRRP